MTITNVVSDRNQYAYTSGTGPFPYTYKIFSAGDLDVYFTPTGQTFSEIDDILSLGVDYTVTNVGDNAGGNVNLVNSFSTTGTITIQRDISFDRTTDYSPGGPFTSVSFNETLDKSRAIEQQIRSLILTRGLYYSTLNDLSYPDTKDNLIPILGAGQIWRMNNAATEIVPADTIEPISCSSLRAELASEANGSDGARLVGFFSQANNNTTVKLELDYLYNEIQTIISTYEAPAYYRAGLNTQLAADTAHDITINPGNVRKGYTSQIFKLETAITKQIDANWAEGTNAGGFPSGLTLSSNTTYHMFLIMKTDGTVDAGFDTSLSATNLLTDASAYTYFIRAMSLRTDGSSNIISYEQFNDRFYLTVPELSVNDTNPGTSAVTFACSVPTGIVVNAILASYFNDTLESVLYISPLISPDTAPSETSPFTNVKGAFESRNTNSVNVLTNTSAQVRYRLSANEVGTVVRIQTDGWIDDFLQ
jgi:hypothetical protein